MVTRSVVPESDEKAESNTKVLMGHALKGGVNNRHFSRMATEAVSEGISINPFTSVNQIYLLILCTKNLKKLRRFYPSNGLPECRLFTPP